MNEDLKIIPVKKRSLPLAEPVKALVPLINILFKSYMERFNY